MTAARDDNEFEDDDDSDDDVEDDDDSDDDVDVDDDASSPPAPMTSLP